MNLRQRTQSQFLGVIAVVLVCLISQAIATAEEPLDQARQLRDRGQYDAALEVLRKISSDTSRGNDDRATADYEIGVTLIYKARGASHPMDHQAVLGEAQGILQQFSTRHAEHPLNTSARSQIGKILVERAKFSVERSKQLASARGKERARAAAKEHYQQAMQIFTDSLAPTREKLKRFPRPLEPKRDREMIELRDQLRRDYLQARLMIPIIKEEQAGMLDETSDERRKLLRSAIDEFQDCYEDYRTRIAGLYALMYQGRCHMKLDEHKEALYCFNELLEQPDSIDALRQLRMKTALLAADCWLDDRQRASVRAIEVMQDLIDKAKADELKEPDWLWLRVKLARAYKLQADDLSKAKEPSAEQKQQHKQALAKALKHARAAANTAGDHGKQARALVAEITETSQSETSEVEPVSDETAADDITGFDEAYRAAREALDRMNQPETQRDKAALQETQRELIRLLKLALDSVDVDTPTEDVNLTRYFLAYAYYSSGDFEKAAETGELLARRFPEHRAARSAGKIAFAAYMKQYEKAAGKRKQLVETRLASICRYLQKTWPDAVIATECAQTLTMLAIRNNRLDEAASKLERVPENASKRGSLEIQLGRALWYASLRESGEEKVKELRDKAERLLEKGIRRPVADGIPTDLVSEKIAEELVPFGPPKVSQSVAIGALSLCQLYVRENDFAKAVALLEDKKIGPHTLVVSKHPVANINGFDVQTLLVAKRAYRGLVESDKTDAATQKEAERKLKEAIVELDKRRKARDERSGGVDIEVTPIK